MPGQFHRLSWRGEIAVAAGLVVAVVAIVAGCTKPSGESRHSTPTFTGTANSTTPSAGAPAPGSEAAATKQLQALKDQDAPVIARVVGKWIPQLSAKHGTQPWTFDSENNVVYDPTQILREHQQLSQQYGAKLLWSGDWTTYDHPDYWVTIVPTTFPDSESVLNWCRSVGRDPDHCSAQIVDKTKTHAT